MIFTPNVELPKKDPEGRTINVVGDGFRGNAQIKSLVIPETYNKIMPNAFRSSTLASVDLSKTQITEIPDSCFRDTDLTKISLPATIKTLKTNCLYNTSLSTINLPDGITTIEDGALFNAPLTSLFIPKSVTSIGDNVFNSAYIVKIVVDDASTTYADSGEIMLLSKDGKNLMLSASLLTFSSLELPNTVETISSYALYNANSRLVYFHEKVSQVEDNVFSSTYLEEIEVENTNPYFIVDANALYNKAQTELIVMIDKELTEFTVPATVTKIYGSAFARCDIGTLNIGASVSSIQNTTFDYMQVSSIVVNGSNSSFKDDADVALLNKSGTILYKYANDNTKTSYSIASSVTTIERLAFYNADKLTSVTLPTNLDYINERAFAFCGGLSTITLPTGMVTTGHQAFYSSSIQSATLSGYVEPEAFANCISLTTLTVANTTTVVDTAVVKNCTSFNVIEFKGTTPPTVYGDLFEGVTSSFSIKVPSASIATYQALRVFFNYLTKLVAA